MDGVVSAFQVISLAIQLVETGEMISKFLTSVQDAPSEVTRLGQTLDQLNSTLKHVSHLLEQQYLVLRLPGSPIFITNALEHCEKKIKTLEEVIQKAKTAMDHRNRVQRSWAAIRFVLKKEYIRGLQSQLRDAEAGLQTAMLSNSWQLQMYSISNLSYGALQAAAVEQPSLAEPVSSTSQYKSVQDLSSISSGSFRSTTKATNLIWYRGFFGSVSIQSTSTSLSRSDNRKPRSKPISEEKIIRIMPTYLHKTLELRCLYSYGQISRTLSMYPILRNGGPVFDACGRGDLRGLQVALSDGTVSPFVLDEDGLSLLHYAVYFENTDICRFLLQIGVDPNHVNLFGNKAIQYLDCRGPRKKVEEQVDCLRLLMESQIDISPRDRYQFWERHIGTVEVAEFMFLHDIIQSEVEFSDGEDSFPPLAAAMREYGRDPSQWENFLRLLLHKRVDLHSPVARPWRTAAAIDYFNSMYPFRVSDYGTPLDELFCWPETAYDGEAAAARWLQILSSEGYDVMAYLEKEAALHAEGMQFTCPSGGLHWRRFEPPRRLLFHWGSSPSVSWESWIDPNSSTCLVREEFKHTGILPPSYDALFYDPEATWPFIYPAWSDFSEGQLYERAQERANRRLRKKSMKAARAQGLKKRERMPGAWPV